MIFSLFKDQKTIEIAQQLAAIFEKTADILKKLPKGSLNKKGILSALNKNKISLDESWPGSEIHLESPHRYIPITIVGKLSGDVTIKEDFSKYELHAIGVYDFKGFGLDLKYDDKNPKANLIDMSFISNRSSDKPTRKAKFLYEEILKIEGFVGKKV